MLISLKLCMLAMCGIPSSTSQLKKKKACAFWLKTIVSDTMDSITNVVQNSPSLKQVRIFYCVKQWLVVHTIPRASYIRRILAAPPLGDQCPRSPMATVLV